MEEIMKLSVIKTFKKVCTLSLVSFILFSNSCALNSGFDHPFDYTVLDDSDYENMSALQFTKIMGNGINLGNTMEAAGSSWLGWNASPEQYESAWGQPKTTKAIFKAYKDAGFDSVRIPVAWLSTMDIANGDYKINENFMAYVENIVQMALDADLIVMINDHWDYGWWALFGKQHENSEELRKEAYKVFDAIWDQVGTRFKNYPYQLIFEAGNEEWGDGFNDEFSIHGKTYCSNDKANEWSNRTEYNKVKTENYKILTELSQYFVDKIRDQGSKNEKRFLLIPGYNTSTHLTSDSEYVMPNDPTNSVQKLLVSVHYYEPALYSILEKDADWGKVATTWGTPDEIKAQNACFAEMQRFVNAGYGVLIGEYGVARLDGKTRKDNDVLWITNILDNCDKYNYCPFLWDCNGYFKKTGTLGFKDEDVAAIFKNRNYASEKTSD